MSIELAYGTILAIAWLVFVSWVIISAMRQAVNEHLDTLADDELERVLRFMQSRYPLQAKAA